MKYYHVTCGKTLVFPQVTSQARPTLVFPQVRPSAECFILRIACGSAMI